MLADHLELAQGRRISPQAPAAGVRAALRAFQAQAVEGHLEAFRRFGQAAMGVVIGLAHHDSTSAGLSCISSAISRSERGYRGWRHDPVVAVLRHGSGHSRAA
jgi:hypothetical protein